MTVSAAATSGATPQTAKEKKAFRRETKRRERRTSLMRTMGILDHGAAAGMVNGFVGGVDAERAVAALRWETENPWARVFEKLSTHPLVGRRIAALSDSQLDGRPQWLGLQVVEAEAKHTDHRRLYRRFLVDVAAVVVPWLALGVSLLLLFSPALFSPAHPSWAAGPLLAVAGGLFALAQARRYPMVFTRVAAVTQLLERLDAGPVRGIPVEVRGRIVGRAAPGYVLSSDLVVQDESGIVALGYRQPIPGADALFGFKKAHDFVDRDVVARGWYRRTPYPVIELRELRTDDSRARPCLWLARFVSAGVLVVAGLAVTAVHLATMGGG
jgi:hypothetical protein